MSRTKTGPNVQMASGKELGKRIRARRLEMNMSVQKVADSLGVQRGYVNQLEHGDKLPSFSTLVDIINTLEISADELLIDYVHIQHPVILQSRLNRILDKATPKQIKRIEAYANFELEYSEKDDNK